MKSAKIIFGALAGVAIGIQIGLLVAPEKGADTRKKLTKKGEEYLNDFNGQLNQLVKGFSEKFDKINKEIASVAEETKAKSNEWLGQAKSKGKDQVEKAKDQFN
ncbi:YtxH domain-containing protein [Lunatibacter salilacus]|uniref:YtxH domain-containing protein n=1 Tax=Lunatibacter salilacus TaxID=2483804 RepID=UPI00131E743C|nr:YtxH domain-containing protein [Lunatibacter salilacus]HSI75442.1 YtxH domain-containing protein [Lunatimonas sp.]